MGLLRGEELGGIETDVSPKSDGLALGENISSGIEGLGDVFT